MSVYSTKTLNRNQAIYDLMKVWKMPQDLTNEELAQEMFNRFGDEDLPNSTLNNYIVED